ncbi:hypothetical protein [Pelagibius marinus]|uniref:hypothetical protein n=1 Tax=Pelagibius marinus TaxID=2762760 RepID=UPI001872FEE4|nr:hypothetical protein [Pelagibius marinus]
MSNAVFVLSALLCVAGAGGVLAQEKPADDTTKLAEEIIDCASLDSNARRLACYDEVAAPLLGVEGASEESDVPAAIHKFTGKDNWNSDVLELTSPWRLVWQNKGSLLTVELHTSQGELVEVVGNQIGEGGGRSTVIGPGSYRLAVRGLGGWQVQLVTEED